MVLACTVVYLLFAGWFGIVLFSPARETSMMRISRR
jgi:hypothetical protein